MLTTSFPALWEDTFTALKARGTRFILLGAAMFRYTDEERAINLEFLRRFRPAIISTRDVPTYEAFKDAADFTYSGIDSGFFASDAYVPFRLTGPDYITVNFDRWPEPSIRLDEENGAADRRFEYLSHLWSLKFPRLQYYLSSKDKVKSYLGALLDVRRLPKKLGDYVVIRPEHRFNPHVTWKIYKQANAVASDEPWSYFTLYANTQLTISDRVHACVATLAYGKPAMLFSPSPRSKLFDRLGLDEIRNRPVTLDREILRSIKDEEISFLKNAVAKGS